MRPSSLLRALLTALLLTLVCMPAQAGYIDHFARPDDVGKFKSPNQGPAHILVVPVFNQRLNPDIPGTMTRLRSFFANPAEDPDAPEVNFTSYWEANSRGAYAPTAEVVDSLRFDGCPLPPALPGCAIPRGDVSSLYLGIDLLLLVLQRLEDRGTDFSKYDVGGLDGQPDGWIDGIIMVANFGSQAGVAFPFGLLSDDGPVEFDGTGIVSVAMAEDEWVAVHEFGHLLGFADLYDEFNQTTDIPYSAMGGWRYDPKIPLLNAFSRTAIGWTEVTEVIGELTTVIPPYVDSGAVFKLGRGSEYFLVTNRGPDGAWDTAMDERGLVVTHVNSRRAPGPEDNDFINTILDCPNCAPWEPLLMIEQADGAFDHQFMRPGNEADDLLDDGDVFAPGPEDSGQLDADNLYWNSNRYDGRPTGVHIRDIDTQSDAPGIRVTLVAPTATPDPCLDTVCAPGFVCEGGSCVAAPEPTAGPTPTPEPTPTPPSSGGGGGGCQQSTHSSAATWLIWLLCSLVVLSVSRRRGVRRASRS